MVNKRQLIMDLAWIIGGGFMGYHTGAELYRFLYKDGRFFIVTVQNLEGHDHYASRSLATNIRASDT
ncbi:hypothetical protein RHGRI_036555 [Rhododendron griersonianum]|uniref:Uncharacterized protein n=1 Tax=Rhododendron griersonianum TaxID=479676 RepID=A0AAV6HPG0_9ERIC|nr:hypothetical protein RHGRI_036555 [Rhododendron griersonianum]